MKKTFRKLAAAVLTGVLALSLAGCGGDSKEQKSAGKGEYANLKEVVLIGAKVRQLSSLANLFPKRSMKSRAVNSRLNTIRMATLVVMKILSDS